MNTTESIYDHAEKKHVSVRRIVDLMSLTNPFGPSEKAKHAIRKAVKDVSLPPDSRTRYLRRYIAKREGIAVEGIFFGQSSSQLLAMLIAAVKPKRVLIPVPIPLNHKSLVERQGAVPVPFSLAPGDGGSTDVETLTGLMNTADMLLLPNPNHLTGGVIPAALIGELVCRLAGTEKLVVVDEALLEFARATSVIDLTNGSGNIAVLRSFSLFHSLGGLPLAYLAASPTLIDTAGRSLDPGPVSILAAAAALASLRDVGFQRRTAECLEEEKVYLKAKLKKAKGLEIVDTPCNFLLIRLKQVVDLGTVFLGRNIFIEMFDDGQGGRFLRLPVRQRRDNARFAKTLLRIMDRQDPSGAAT
jgi:histidinol-phosphate/aromatic aminotransferase/cobyric acid decarboxylase-like protein